MSRSAFVQILCQRNIGDQVMNEVDAWRQGYSDGIELVVEKINEWCGLDCKTIVEIIKEINHIKQGKTQ